MPLAVADIAPRSQMGFSLGWHIVLACLGVGLPALVLFAEWRGQRTGDPVYRLLARRWARALGVLFAVGAVSGTILSFEMGQLWSGLMDHYGSVIGLPFAIEGFAFFIEAIFLGIYLYGWDRLSPRAHLLSGVPIVVAGALSAFFVVTANAWMNSPQGFREENGKVVSVDPLKAIFNKATWPETTHMLLAAIMVTGFVTASVYAVAMLRGRDDAYHRLGLRLGLGLGALAAPVQVVVGDWAARYVADDQPIKLAAMEGRFRSGSHADLSIGGVYIGAALRGALRIPDGLSLLVHFNVNGKITGLETVPAALRPPVAIVHLAFDTMVGIGFGLLALGGWFGWTAWRRHRLPRTRWFLRAVAVSGLASVVAMEAGWVVTEVGRQPWVVYGLLKTSAAVNPAHGVGWGLPVLLVVYAVLTVVLISVLRRMARDTPVPITPQDTDADQYAVV
ncbi:MAG TPA: cytochrome ubiquinol oxidase subunit I [Jatrophihabitantaceae bacterium]